MPDAEFAFNLEWLEAVKNAFLRMILTLFSANFGERSASGKPWEKITDWKKPPDRAFGLLLLPPPWSKIILMLFCSCCLCCFGDDCSLETSAASQTFWLVVGVRSEGMHDACVQALQQHTSLCFAGSRPGVKEVDNDRLAVSVQAAKNLQRQRFSARR